MYQNDNRRTESNHIRSRNFPPAWHPVEIISDRGPQFDSTFWKSFFSYLNVNVKLSTAYHPQTDGQSERTTQTLESYLRCFVNHLQDDWTSWLPLVEFSYNSSLHSAINCTPFQANNGFNPPYVPRPTAPGEIELFTLEHRLQAIHSECTENL